MFNNLSVQRKLNILSVIFLIPVVFLTYLLVVQSQKDISFSEKEIWGNDYITPARSLITRISKQYATPSAPGTQSSDYSSTLNALKAKATELDEEMKSAELSAKAFAALGKISSPARNAADNTAAYQDATSALRDLIARIGDSSNLILDPDLDSYYAMDLLVLKLPDISYRLDKVKTIVLDQLPKTNIVLDDRAIIISAVGELNTVISGIASSLDSGYRGNADGTLKKAMDPLHKTLTAKLQAYLDIVDKAQSEKVSDRPSEKDVIAAYTEAFTALDSFWEGTAREMDRLLTIRVNGFTSTLTFRLITTAIVVALAFVFLIYIAGSIKNSLKTFKNVMGDLASGNTGIDVPYRGQTDEIGLMANALETFRLNAIKQAELQEKEHQEATRREARNAKMELLSRTFDKAVTQMLSRVTSLVENLFKAANDMRREADSVEQKGREVLTVTEASSANFQAISAAGEELSSSIQEILRQTQHTVDVTRQVNDQTVQTNTKVSGLANSIVKINEITDLISSIAEQTNLLALNATIEASRAGEAGRGFTVVAGEVKNLANQTATATQDISRQVQAIQSETKDVVDSIRTITETISQMSGLASTVASAVNQQGAATSEISRRVDETAQGAQNVASNIAVVNDAAIDVKSSASSIFEAVNELKKENDVLKNSVEDFLFKVHNVDHLNDDELKQA